LPVFWWIGGLGKNDGRISRLGRSTYPADLSCPTP
jgi:hypothetical protein